MRMTGIIGAALLGVLLAGCGSPAAPGVRASSEPSAEAPVSETAASVVEVFGLPADCASILPASRLAEFEADGIVLLGGPGGIYGDEYLAEPSPEQQAGGITCIWGPLDTEMSVVTISVAPLSAATRPALVQSLAVDQGLNETTGDGVAYYWLLGDRDHHPAMLNVLTADSWISIIQTIGGTDNYAEAERIAAEVHEQVYN